MGRCFGRLPQRQLLGLRNVQLSSWRSFFQSACMLGYCLFPLNVVSAITLLIGSWLPSPIKLGLVVLSFIWATMCKLLTISASMAFIGELVPERKRKLALYPVCLFYLFLSWFVLIIWDLLYLLLTLLFFIDCLSSVIIKWSLWCLLFW